MVTKRWNEVINGVSFPFTKFENGIIICDYPMYNPVTSNKITEEGRIQLNKLIEATKDITKKYNNVK
jgi:hypothetical protein